MLAEVAEMSDPRADGPVTVPRPAEALVSSVWAMAAGAANSTTEAIAVGVYSRLKFEVFILLVPSKQMRRAGCCPLSGMPVPPACQSLGIWRE